MNELCDTTATIVLLKKRVQKFVEDREWGKYHNSKDLAISIAVEASELLEIFQWVREKDIEKLLKDADKFTRVEEELADFARTVSWVLSPSSARKMMAKVLNNIFQSIKPLLER